MKHHRRDVLLGSASIAASAALSGPSFGQGAPDKNTKELSDQFGMTNYLNGTPDLNFLLNTQQQAPQVPLNLRDFLIYLENSPLLRRIRGGESRELFHLMQWHSTALDLTSQDHTTIVNTTDPTFGEQFGPTRSSRALAIFHLAVFEAVNAIYRTRRSYRGLQAQIIAAVGTPAGGISPRTASVRLAIGYAAYGTLSVLYKNKLALIDAVLKQLVPIVGDGDSPAAKMLGARIGEAAARAVLLNRNYDFATRRFNDGSRDGFGPNGISVEPSFATQYPTPRGILDWQIDPITQLGVALGGNWNEVRPFVLNPANLFIPPPPPAANSSRFQVDYADVRALGGAVNPPAVPPRHPTGTTRTGTGPNAPLDAANETFKGIFWGYDGTALLCAPPRLYNQIATTIAYTTRPITKVEDMSFYLALVNIALADAGIAAWTAKYRYNYARPVSYIRQFQPNNVILGTKNSDWTPLGAPTSNGQAARDNLTPPFPAYPSGHATFGGALFQVLRRFFNTGEFGFGEPNFLFVSDEYNGVNRAATGEARPRVVRAFRNLTEAETENARSRIWIGVHWQFDADEGIAQGRRVGNFVFDNTFTT